MFDYRSVDVFNLKSVAFFVDQKVEQVEFNSSLVLTCKQQRYAADLQRKKTSLKMCLSTCPTWGQMILIHSHPPKVFQVIGDAGQISNQK